MDNPKPSRRKSKAGVREIKALIAALSLAAVLVFWNLFSSQLGSDVNAALASLDSAPAQPAPGLMLDLPPIPTLIPNNTEIVAIGPQPKLNPAPSSSPQAPQVVSQAPVKIFMGGARPQARSSAPAPVTRTRSSR